jgi:hypothetical protein
MSHSPAPEELDPQYELKRRELSRKGKFAFFIGGTVAFLGGITFALFFFTALTAHSMAGPGSDRDWLVTLGFAAFLYFIGIVLMVGGGLVALIGAGVYLFANWGRALRFHAAGTVPVARAVARQMAEVHDGAQQGAPRPPAPPP